jgi:hypothetical protein
MYSTVSKISNKGVDIGIGMLNHRKYLYSVNIKYKKMMKTELNVEINIPGEAKKII